METEILRNKSQNFLIELRYNANAKIFTRRRRPNAQTTQTPQNDFLELFQIQSERLRSATAQSDESALYNALSLLQGIVGGSASVAELPLNELFESGAVAAIIELLAEPRSRAISESALTLLSNASACDAERLEWLYQRGLLDLLRPFLAPATEPSLVISALWTLANFIGESLRYRKLVESADVWPLVIALWQKYETGPQVTWFTFAWLFANAMRGEAPPSPLEEQFLSALCHLVEHARDEETLAEAIWGVYYYVDRPLDANQRLLRLADFALEPRLTVLLSEAGKEPRLPLIKLAAALTRGGSAQISRIYSPALLAAFARALDGGGAAEKRTALGAMCNLALSVDAAFGEMARRGLVELSAAAIAEESDEVAADALDFFKTVVYRNEAAEIDTLLNQYSLLERVLSALSRSDKSALKAALECVEALLEFGAEMHSPICENIVAEQFRKHSLYANFEKIAYNENSIVQKYYSHISHKFGI